MCTAIQILHMWHGVFGGSDTDCEKQKNETKMQANSYAKQHFRYVIWHVREYGLWARGLWPKVLHSKANQIQCSASSVLTKWLSMNTLALSRRVSIDARETRIWTENEVTFIMLLSLCAAASENNQLDSHTFRHSHGANFTFFSFIILHFSFYCSSLTATDPNGEKWEIESVCNVSVVWDGSREQSDQFIL